jgi:hypothetical protein
VPGWYAKSVRRGLLLLFQDGSVFYTEGRGKRDSWHGRIGDLGRPEEVPNAFVVAKNLRLHTQASERTLKLKIGGKPRILCFTGLTAEADKVIRGGITALKWVPIEDVKTVAEWAENGINRVKNPHNAKNAAMAAQVWRGVLEGTIFPRNLPPVQLQHS